ncbi:MULTISPECIES: hypothetical protein [Xanthomonas]|uniref:hypothetical protein n=1 Tax=Xanthomonas TaxID=338 RepID=UPI001E59177C|nr:hypothetical protein [Xanthomonas euvesicatoria]MCC8613393.1 hypothetical protein [Xanthomonas euvesicatoria pv. euvesicatoria]
MTPHADCDGWLLMQVRAAHLPGEQAASQNKAPVLSYRHWNKEPPDMETVNNRIPHKPAPKIARKAGDKRKAKQLNSDALLLLGFANWLLERLEGMPSGAARDELLTDARMTLDVVREDLPSLSTRSK